MISPMVKCYLGTPGGGSRSKWPLYPSPPHSIICYALDIDGQDWLNHTDWRAISYHALRMNHQLVKRWQESHRGRLHDPTSWTSRAGVEPSLTYVPTGAGFTGHPQLQRFVALFPASGHSLAPEQLTRYNNDYRVINCTADESQGLVTEELVVSSLHNSRCDYMMPGVEATNLTYVASIVLVAKYDRESLLLESVRVYWDQATLFRQLGVFHLAFHNLIKATGKMATFENELDQMPIVDGVRVAQRLLHPIGQNSNLLVSLEALEEAALKAKSGREQPVKLSPIGGLDNITELAHNLPPVSPKRQPTLKAGTGLSLENSIFAGELEANQLSLPSHSAPARVHSDGNIAHHLPNAALTSHFVFGDGSAEPVQPVIHDLSRIALSPFGEQHDVAQHRPSITVDPMRNVSRVFNESSSPFHPGLPLTDRSRFESKVFSNSPLATPATKPQPQFQSHIFTPEEEEQREKREGQSRATQSLANAHSSPFGTDEDGALLAGRQQRSTTLAPSASSLPAQEQPRKSLQSHFSVSGPSFAADTDKPLPSFSGRAGNPHTNRSSIRLGDAPDGDGDIPRATATGAATLNPRMASHNDSQLQLGDNPSLPPLYTSTRVLQPPGGHSSILLG